MAELKHNRKLNRMRGYDYSTGGAYFVTICVHGQQNLFGEIINGNMILNDAGNMIKTVWDEIPCYYHGTGIDEFIVMPNHVHGIIIVDTTSVHPGIVMTTPCGCAKSTGQETDITNITNGQARGLVPTGSAPAGVIILSLPDIMHRYKTMTTKRYTDGVKQNGWPGFFGKLWQRSYHDRIIRNDEELNRIQQYIINNPSKLENDRDNHKDLSLQKTVRTTPRGCPSSAESLPEQLKSSLPSIEEIEAELEGLK